MAVEHPPPLPAFQGRVVGCSALTFWGTRPTLDVPFWVAEGVATGVVLARRSVRGGVFVVAEEGLTSSLGVRITRSIPTPHLSGGPSDRCRMGLAVLRARVHEAVLLGLSQSAAGQLSLRLPRRLVHSATESTSAWRGKTFSVRTRWTSSSTSAQASLNTVSS